MPRHDHKGKLRRQLCQCICGFWSPFFTHWLLLQVLINSGVHAARMHFPGGEENIQEKKKKKQKEAKIIINPSFRFSVITLRRVGKSWLLIISASGFWAISLKRSSICIRSPICQSVYKAIKCSLISSFPLWESIKWYKQQDSESGVRTSHIQSLSCVSVPRLNARIKLPWQ